MGRSATLSLFTVLALFFNLGLVIAQSNITLSLPGNAIIAGAAALQLLPNQGNWLPNSSYQQFQSAGAASGSCNVLRIIFNGTAITVYGGPTNTTNLTSLSAMLDSVNTPVATKGAGNDVMLFTAGSLEPTVQHVLVLYTKNCSESSGESQVTFTSATITVPGATTALLTALPNYNVTAEDAAQKRTVDIFPLPDLLSPNGVQSVILGNSSSFSTPASLAVTFQGTGIELYTYYVPKTTLSSAYMTIDGRGIPEFNVSSDQTSEDPVLIANIQHLNPGFHSLSLFADPIQGTDSILSFAFANVTGFSSDGKPNSIPPVGTSSSTGTPTGGSTPSGPATTNAPDLAASSSNTSMAGPIAGGVIGALVVVLVALLLFLRLRKRRLARTTQPDMEQKVGDTGGTDAASLSGSGENMQSMYGPVLHIRTQELDDPSKLAESSLSTTTTVSQARLENGFITPLSPPRRNNTVRAAHIEPFIIPSPASSGALYRNRSRLSEKHPLTPSDFDAPGLPDPPSTHHGSSADDSLSQGHGQEVTFATHPEAVPRSPSVGLHATTDPEAIRREFENLWGEIQRVRLEQTARDINGTNPFGDQPPPDYFSDAGDNDREEVDAGESTAAATVEHASNVGVVGEEHHEPTVL